MSDLNNNNINNTLFPNSVKSSNNHSSNINYNINDLYHEEFKLFFRKYVSNQRKKENLDSNHNSEEGLSASDSGFSDKYNELNNIYLKCFKNLNQFLKVNKNSKGIRLEGNKLLENISLEHFNELFSQYGKGIKKKIQNTRIKLFLS